MSRPILALVVDRRASTRALPEAVEAAFRGGADWLQLRERTLEGAAWLAWAETLIAAARRGAGKRAPRILVNRRVDAALALAADGVHLGFDAVTPAEARDLLGPRAEIGVSLHAAEEVAAAADGVATYAHLAPIYAPLSKPASRAALGPGALAEACAHGLPVLAQGGVTPARCAAVVAAGARGVAVTGAILMERDPHRAAASLRAALDAA